MIKAPFAELEIGIISSDLPAVKLAGLQHPLQEDHETERLHLAQELHDGPLQDLHSVMFRLGILEESLTAEVSLGQLAAIQATLQKVIQTMRSLCAELRPPALAPFGLEKAIHSYVENFQKTYPQLKIELDLMADGQLLAQQTRLGLFRICQELLNNVMWHAQASHVVIHFGVYSEQVILEVKDNGCGFRPPERLIELAQQDHLGLVGVNERVQAMDGQMKIISVPGQGTLIRVLVPYSPTEETV